MSADPMGALAAAVCAVMQESGAVQKTGHNAHGRYSYASDADLLYALRPAMARHGLMLAPVRQDVTRSENSGSKMRHHVVIVVTWRLLHTGGGSLDLQTVGEGADSLDKAAYKAMTGALKYALRHLFLTPTGDDPENDSRNRAPEPTPAEAPTTWNAKERTAFCAKLGDMGVSYDDLKAYCLAHGKPKPSSGSKAYRAALLKALGEPDSEAMHKLDTWLGKRADSESHPF